MDVVLRAAAAAVTLPAGNAAAVFFRDTTVIGVVWLGENFIVARGREGALIRSSGPEELARLALALELPVKVIHVPPAAPPSVALWRN